MGDRTKPPSTKTIRALDRGLQVIELLSQGGAMTLADLRKACGLSNPTLLRILLTLQVRGWVRRNLVEGRYELAHSLGTLLDEAARAHPLAELAAPFLLELRTRQATWPSDLCSLVGPGQIEIVESTRLRGPMAPTRTSLGIRPSMVMSAHGRVILAFSSEEQGRRHIEVVRQTGSKEDILRIDNGSFAKEIAQTRARGYGLREPDYWQPPFDPGPELGAMAVPILSRSGVHGSLSLVWIASETSLKDILSQGGLQDLQRTSAKIGVALEKAGVSAPDLQP